MAWILGNHDYGQFLGLRYVTSRMNSMGYFGWSEGRDLAGRTRGGHYKLAFLPPPPLAVRNSIPRR
jgi:hypothetical protein